MKHTQRTGFFVGLALLCAGTPAAALAQDPPAASVVPSKVSAWHLEAEVFTDFPIQVAAQVGAEFPYGVRVSTSLGILPEPYMGTINSIVTAAGGYSEQTGDLILAILKNSLLWRLQVGWKPWQDYGFYFEAGYMLLTLGGSASNQELIAGVIGRDPPGNGAGGRGGDYEVASTLHMVTAEAGWRWLVWDDRLLLRTALTFAGTLASSTTATPRFSSRNPAAQQAIDSFARFTEDYLNETYTTYVFSPGINVSVGWRFF